MTVGELNRTMSSRELTEWMIYATIEPFGPAREDYRAALNASVVANCNGAKSQPDDFIKPFSHVEHMVALKEKEEQERFSRKQEAQMAILKRMMGAKNGGN